MVCNSNNKLNEDLMLLNFTNKKYARSELILRCSKGHILLYEGSNDHIDGVKKFVMHRENVMNKEKSEIDKLKQENSLLKKEIEFLKNHEPSAPPLLEVEAVVIK